MTLSLILDPAVRFRDFRVIYEGSRLLWANRSAEAYDAANFQLIEDSSLPEGLRQLDVFISPPPFANFVGPFTLLSPTVALVLWTVLGLVIYTVSHKALNLSKAVWLTGLVLPMSLYNLFLGQTGFFALGLATLIHTLCIQEKKVLVGLVAGLTILKPPLFIGLFIWWVIDWKRWKVSLAAASVSGLAITTSTLWFGVRAWEDFLGAIETRSALEGVTALQFSLPETVVRLFSHSIGLSVYAYLFYLALGAFLIWYANKKWEGRLDVISGAVLLVSVFISPHLLIYDSVMLVIPLAVAIQNGVLKKDQQIMVALMVGSVPLTVLAAGPIPALNEYVAVSTFAMITASWVWVKSINSTDPRIATTKGFETLTQDSLGAKVQ